MLGGGLLLPGMPPSHSYRSVCPACTSIYLIRAKKGMRRRGNIVLIGKIFCSCPTKKKKKNNSFEVGSWLFAYCLKGKLSSTWGAVSERLSIPAAYSNSGCFMSYLCFLLHWLLCFPRACWGVWVNFCANSAHPLFFFFLLSVVLTVWAGAAWSVSLL